MGGIGIWGLYFIGNRAMVLGDGSDKSQLAYSAGLTALSFFIPIFVLLIAFSVVGATDEQLDILRVVLGGMLVGLGVCGMHYLGQAGISNYECVYSVVYVVGAATVSLVASIIAIATFCFFRSAWNVRWWCRILSAVMLATAVSGMHWVAAVGTKYQNKEYETQRTTTYSRNNTSIGVVVLVSSNLLQSMS